MHRMDPDTRDKIIQKGIEAATQGRAVSANPYQPSMPEYHVWREGWFSFVNAEQGIPDPMCV